MPYCGFAEASDISLESEAFAEASDIAVRRTVKKYRPFGKCFNLDP